MNAYGARLRHRWFSAREPREPSPAARRNEAIGAWAIWGLMGAATLWFVAVYGFTMPYADEWGWLPVTAGRQPASAAWFWSPLNEHRMLLPRLIYLAIGRATGFNFKAGAFFNVLLLAGMAAAMMLAARRLRGRTSIYDAFFPLLLLHWAQFENIGWGFQVNFITSVALAGAVLLFVARPRQRLSLVAAIGVAVCLAATGACGVFGLAYLPAMACWLLAAGVGRWRDGRPGDRFAAAVMATVAVGLIGEIAACTLGVSRDSARLAGAIDVTRTAVQFLGGGLGAGGKESWPVSGVLVVAAVAYSLRQLWYVFRHQPAERLRTAGFFCFLAGAVSLAVAVGIGRGADGPRVGFAQRYMTLAAPVLCLFYLQWTLYGTAAAKLHLQRTLALLLCPLTAVNMVHGLRFAVSYQRLESEFVADVHDGISPAALAVRYDDELGFAPTPVFAARLEMLRDARLGPYRGPQAAPELTWQARSFGEFMLWQPPAQRLALTRGESFVEPLAISTGGTLKRIDVKLSECRGRRLPDLVDWRLLSPGPDRKGLLLARGTVDTRERRHNDYVRLLIPDNLPRGSGRFSLVLSCPADCPADRAIELPLYSPATTAYAPQRPGDPPATALSLKGCAFFEPALLR
jgi:hypothetical protein